MNTAKRDIPQDPELRVVHSQLPEGYDPALTPGENEALDNLAIVITNRLLNSQK